MLEILTASPSIDAVLVAGSQGIQRYVEPQLEALTDLAARVTMPVVFCTYAQIHTAVVSMLAGAGFPCVASMPNAARMIGAMADYGQFLERFVPDDQAALPRLAMTAQVTAALDSRGRTLCEYEAKAVLQDLGIAGNSDNLAGSEKQAVAAATQLARPVALKVQSPDISHRHQAGCVALGVTGADAVREAYRTILKNAQTYAPGSDIRGVLVSPMSEHGSEFIVGINRDQDFGPMIVLGAGGTLVEVLDDVIVTPAPVSREVLLELIAGWKGRRLLDGSAGIPPADSDALVDLTVAVSRLAAAADNIASLDINPVIVHARGRGVTVVDALIVTGEAGQQPVSSTPTTMESAT